MASDPKTCFVADVGNSTIDIGEFAIDDLSDGGCPAPIRTTKVDINRERQLSSSDRGWLRDLTGSRWLIGSVNQAAKVTLDHLLYRSKVDVVHFANRKDFEIPTAIRNPQTVGIDRLAGATAANQMRSPEKPAIVVDAGTAITIDCVSHEGVFLGGMIAPGLQLCAEALGSKTDQLPTLDLQELRPPQLIGDETKTAIAAGTYWLVAAGVDGILTRLKRELAGPCDIFVTGGSMPMLLPHLGLHQPVHCPHLVLSGIAMTLNQSAPNSEHKH